MLINNAAGSNLLVDWLWFCELVVRRCGQRSLVTVCLYRNNLNYMLLLYMFSDNVKTNIVEFYSLVYVTGVNL